MGSRMTWIALVVIAAVWSAAGQSCNVGVTESQILRPSLSDGASFGAWIKAEKTQMVVTAHLDNNAKGSAIVYKKNSSGSWVQEGKLVSGDTSDWRDDFGWGVDIKGDWLMAGAPNYANTRENGEKVNSGAAFLFKRVNGVWKKRQRILASDVGSPKFDTRFGWSIRIVVKNQQVTEAYITAEAARNYRTNENDMGAVYIFKWNGSRLELDQTVNGPDPGSDFGHEVDVNGNRMVVCAPKWGAGEDGGVFVYQRADSNSPFRLMRNMPLLPINVNDASRDDYAHHARFSPDASFLGIGSPYAYSSLSKQNRAAGSLYIYKWNGSKYVFNQLLVPPGFEKNIRYASRFEWTKKTLVVGAYFAKNSDTEVTGVAYVYGNCGCEWVLKKKIEPKGVGEKVRYGLEVDVTSEEVIVAAPRVTPEGRNVASGVVYVYKLNPVEDGQVCKDNDILAMDPVKLENRELTVDVTYKASAKSPVKITLKNEKGILKAGKRFDLPKSTTSSTIRLILPIDGVLVRSKKFVLKARMGPHKAPLDIMELSGTMSNWLS